MFTEDFKRAYENGNTLATYNNQILEINGCSMYLNTDTIKVLVSFNTFLNGIMRNDAELKLIIGPQKDNDRIFFVKIFDNIYLKVIPLFYFKRIDRGLLEFKFNPLMHYLYTDERKIMWTDWSILTESEFIKLSSEQIIERYFSYLGVEFTEEDLTLSINKFTSVCPADVIKRFLEMVATILPQGN